MGINFYYSSGEHLKNIWKSISKIDTHVHITLRKMMWTDIHKNTPDKYLELMAEHQIRKAIVVPINYPFYHAKRDYGANYLDAIKFNNDTQALIAKKSKRFICFSDLYFDTFFDEKIKVKDVIEELERCIFELKLKGIKIHPENMVLKANDSRIIEILKFAKKNDLPVIIHSNPQKGWRNCSNGPKYIAELLKKVKHQKVLISHMGGRYFKDLSKIDCWFDFSMANTPIWKEIGPTGLEKAIRYLGIDRCCFASDFSVVKYSSYYKYLNQIDFTEEEVRLIAIKNAESFLE